MRQLTPEGRRIVEGLAHRHGVSIEAVMTMLHALIEGQGTMAQFDHRNSVGWGSGREAV